MHHPSPIYDFLAQAIADGRRTALVTITAVTGASSRNPGTHMAVAEDGSYAGSFSGGCIEAAVVGEAIEAIKADAIREVRFGAGSRYIDIRLPCGGSVDLLFNPVREAGVVSLITDQLHARRPVTVRLPRDRGDLSLVEGGQDWRLVVEKDALDLTYIPRLRITIFGHGAAVEALERAASAYGADIAIFTPDREIVERAAARGCFARLLRTPTEIPDAVLDRWTAVVFLFHDHDWEPYLLKAMLAQPAHFVGAMGSRHTHEGRLERLREIGAEQEDLARIISPIGLIPSSRDPETLALSTMAQVVAGYHSIFMSNRG